MTSTVSSSDVHSLELFLPVMHPVADGAAGSWEA
jgi:hypothetical protein